MLYVESEVITGLIKALLTEALIVTITSSVYLPFCRNVTAIIDVLKSATSVPEKSQWPECYPLIYKMGNEGIECSQTCSIAQLYGLLTLHWLLPDDDNKYTGKSNGFRQLK